MLTQPLLQSKLTDTAFIKQSYKSDKAVMAFFALALSYLVLGLTFGLLGSMQYVLPDFLRDALAFQKTRPLHVYLVIAWIFTAAQGGVYYYLPRIAKRPLYWVNGVWIHLGLQLITSASVVTVFFMGKFGGREYLEFPPMFGLLIAASWAPFAINFFATLKANYFKAPVYYFSWTIGIVFFYITLSESYLWVFDYFRTNEIRDITIQWKALGSMVGSWNMLIYGCSMYVMQQISGKSKAATSPMAFFFFFIGFTNLMFNWGHHTYIVPAAPWVKNVAYIISMTELLIFGHLILQWRKTVSNAQKHYHLLPYRLLSIADFWILLNLTLAIFISVPAFNYYTHGTHITVAHAMGATIGINTMLLFASVLYVLAQKKPAAYERKKKMISFGIYVTNFSLIIFWAALIGSGVVKILGKMNGEHFAVIMEKSKPFFKLFAVSGAGILIGLCFILVSALGIILSKDKSLVKLTADERSSIELELAP
jgi:nitric oxide reductase subunit B